MFFRNGSEDKCKYGFSRALMLCQVTFMSSAIHPPPTPMVGVIPKPTPVALNSAFEEKFVISLQTFEVSGSQMPASIVVEVLACVKIPYTFKKAVTRYRVGGSRLRHLLWHC